jgi:hypothetical protein
MAFILAHPGLAKRRGTLQKGLRVHDKALGQEMRLAALRLNDCVRNFAD